MSRGSNSLSSSSCMAAASGSLAIDIWAPSTRPKPRERVSQDQALLQKLMGASWARASGNMQNCIFFPRNWHHKPQKKPQNVVKISSKMLFRGFPPDSWGFPPDSWEFLPELFFQKTCFFFLNFLVKKKYNLCSNMA